MCPIIEFSIIMPTEEEIKRRLLQQRQMEMQEHMQTQVQQQQLQEQLKAVSWQVLEPKARERLNNLRVVKPELAMQLEAYLAQLYQAGQIKQKITEEQLVSILKKLGEKRDIKIRRK